LVSSTTRAAKVSGAGEIGGATGALTAHAGGAMGSPAACATVAAVAATTSVAPRATSQLVARAVVFTAPSVVARRLGHVRGNY
jgi:hypothetical protein